ncbi:MAG: sporulation integral membrane protein YtvI [Clostridiales bacterium]|jgi:sporulation integral membrane protein YtvI|nr:sporulation integral membrane protein YtvI [Clostridiales bacterium]
MGIINSKHAKFFLFVIYAVIVWFFAMHWLPTILACFMPFILAYFVAVMTQPVKRFLTDKCKFAPKIASFVALVLVLLLFCAILGFIITQLVIEVMKFSQNSSLYISNISNFISEMDATSSEWQTRLPNDFVPFYDMAIEAMSQQAIAMVSGLSQWVVNWATNLARSMPATLLSWLIFVVASFFMCMDFSMIKRSVMLQIPLAYRAKALQVKTYAGTAVAKYMRGMGMVMLVSFAVLCIGLLVLKINYAITIALVLAVLEILPLIGTGIILCPWGVITILNGNYAVGIGLIVLYLVNVIIRQVVEPKILSQSLGLYPMVTLICVYVGLKLFGFAGVIVFPILMLVAVYLQGAGVIQFWKTDKSIKLK